jgi:AraC family transcriptional activator of pobA
MHAVPTLKYGSLSGKAEEVERHFTEKRLPKEYADMLYIAPNHLNALCKTHLGMRAGEVVRSRIAKRLLVSKNRNVADIAYALNFNEASCFTRFFGKMAGVTPEEFRKSIHR